MPGPFCGKCGTYTRPVMGKTMVRVCPKCFPDRIPPEPKRGRDTGVPCKDNGVCRPERCVIALECREAKR